MLPPRTEAERTGRHHHVSASALVIVTILVAATVLIPAALAQGSSGSGDVDDGRGVFASNCAACHGAAAQGRGAAPSLIGVEDRHTVDEIGALIRQGRAGMPSFDARLSDAEIDDVVAFLGSISDDEVEPRQGRRMHRWWDDMMWDGAGGRFVAIWMLLGLLLLVLVAVGIMWVVRRASSGGARPADRPGPPPPSSGSAREELDRRYARGEISREEYRTMRDDLDG